MYTKPRKHNNRLVNRRQRKGASVVELAVTSPLLLLLLLGTIDGGQYVNSFQTISNASREGARVAARATTSTATEIENSVMDYLSGAFSRVPPATLNAAITIEVSDAEGVPLVNLGGVPTGAAVQVSVSLQFDAVRAIPGLDELDDRTIEVSTIMRRE